MTTSLSFTRISDMGTKESTVAKDWKFIVQLVVLVSGIGGGLAANTSINERVARIEERAAAKEETIKDLRENIRSLTDEVRRLREEMAAKKIVGQIGSGNSVAGEKYAEQ